jgi:RimJ/RimL family protein N-acetyltransferase
VFALTRWRIRRDLHLLNARVNNFCCHAVIPGYLFDRKKENQIRLIIHPDNAGSKRVAQKCGYKYEGVARGAWFHRGRNQDVEVHALLRDEYYEMVE